MSTNAAVRSAWQTNVFDNFTTTSYNYLLVPDPNSLSANVTAGYSSDGTVGIVDHFQYSVSSTEVPKVSKQNDVLFTVQVLRIIEDDPDGSNQNTLIDDFRTLINYVNDNLGTSWAGTVDLVTDFPDTLELTFTQWGSVPVWQGEITFKALKQIDA